MTLSERPKAIIFDWDNTLVSTWDVIREAMNTTLVAFDMEPWTIEETRNRVKKSMRESFPDLFGGQWEKASEIFYGAYEAVHVKNLTEEAGAEVLLSDLGSLGIHLSVVSNKNGGYLRKESTHLGWDRYFRNIIGATDAEHDKPAVEPVQMALRGSGIEAGNHVWFVGDSSIDLECAYNTDCTPVLIREKPPENGEFDLYPPKYYFNCCRSLGKFIESL